jgi:imidazolonepropionase-like amidohydrolase
MHEEGVPMLLGTDAPNPFVVPGFSVYREAGLLAHAGLSPFDVLRAATVDAARYRGDLGECGTVTPGKRADLLVLERDPLSDVEALRSISTVVANGFVLARATARGARGGEPATPPCGATR